MKFFLPPTTEEGLAEETYQTIKMSAEETMRWAITERRIFSLDFQHDAERYYAEVGQLEPRTGEPVIAILESNAYLICTPNRGVLRGMPIMVGRQDVFRIEDFEDSPNHSP